tara:strand:+ start:367 stop:486 length:120 start_codon:yes stop_codon:yes gene_type:complete
MFPLIFSIEHDRQKEKTTKVNNGHPVKINGLVSLKIFSL